MPAKRPQGAVFAVGAGIERMAVGTRLLELKVVPDFPGDGGAVLAYGGGNPFERLSLVKHPYNYNPVF